MILLPSLAGGEARAQAGPYVYVPNLGNNTVSVIDTPSATVVGAAIPVGANPYTAAVRGDESLAYVTNISSGNLSVINTATNAVVGTIAVGANPLGVAVSSDGTRAYVTNNGSASVSVIDTATNTVIGTIPVGTAPAGVVVNPDGARAYVANQSSNAVSVINTATNTVVANIAVGSNPYGVVVSPDGTRAYVTNLGSNSVSVINTATNTVIGTIAVGSAPAGVVFSPDGTRAYVANNSSNSVSVINTATSTVIGTIAVGSAPAGVVVSPDGTRAYVTNQGSDSVSVIDTATNAVISNIVGANSPFIPGICSNGNALLASGLTFKANTSGALGCTGTSGPVFTGGTMQFAGTGITSNLSITLMSQGGIFDTAGNNATLSGAIGGPGGLTKIGLGTLTLSGNSTYAGATFVNTGTLQAGAVNAFSPFSSIAVATGASLDLNSFNQSIGSLAGNGNVTLGSATLTTGNDGTSTIFSGTISGTGGLTKIGAGMLTLSGNSTYAGATFVNTGTLQAGAVNAFSPFSSIAVATGASLDLNSFNQVVGGLTGTGAVANNGGGNATLTIASGGIFAPGNGTPGTSMAIAPNLAFMSGAFYLVQINTSTASFANVTGTATLGGATVNAVFANGSYIAKQYTILTATGSVSGTFNPTVVNTNLPSNFHTTLSYDAHDAYLNLVLNFAVPGSLNGNQAAVGNALTSFFNSTGSIPLVFSALTPAGLSQVSGETATGSQQTTYDAMGLFLGLMTDPFMNRGDGFNPTPAALGFANAANKTNDAFAKFTKAPPVFEPRWNVWAAGFGGSQTTDGNAAAGSSNTTSNIAATAVGADYLISPTTIAGFALAGGGTSFSVANGGTGRSDLFQAGAYLRHTNGPAYLSAALAYGWQDITTNRTVTAAGFDQLRAEFNANAYSGRLEGGYRFVSQMTGGVGITPYAAAQFVTLDLPAYAEHAIVGTNNFALAYGARDPTDARTELGIRTDKSFATANGILTLRGRFAWAHDYDPDRSIGATFQSLPGASFVVNGAAQAADSALTAASIEIKWRTGWSAAATFEGEFSNVTASYAGKGVVRYTW